MQKKNKKGRNDLDFLIVTTLKYGQKRALLPRKRAPKSLWAVRSPPTHSPDTPLKNMLDFSPKLLLLLLLLLLSIYFTSVFNF